MFKNLLVVCLILLVSVSGYAIKPSSQEISIEAFNDPYKKDSLDIEKEFIFKKNQATEDPNNKRFNIAAKFAVAGGIMTVIGLLLALISGLSFSAATAIGIYLVVIGIPWCLISSIFVVILKKKIVLTEKEEKLYKAVLVFNAISALILLGINLIP